MSQASTSQTAAGGSKGSGAVNENAALKAYEKKVKEDVRMMHENLHEMLKLLKIDDDRTLKSNEELGMNKCGQAQIDQFELQIRATNIVKSTESLTKIVSDLKDLIILNDFKSINAQITSQCLFLKGKQNEIDEQLTNVKDVLFKMLHDLQHEYYTSHYK